MSDVIKVHSPIEVKPANSSGWEIVFWREAFDFTTPFQNMLKVIAKALGRDAVADLKLSTFDPDEDFVDGKILLDKGEIAIYYEYSLGYLSLMSEDEALLNEVCIRLRPHVLITDDL